MSENQEGQQGGGASEGGAAAPAAYDWAAAHGEAFKPFEPVVQAKGWKNPLEALSAYAELEGRLGKSITPPGADAKPEDWQAVFDRLGRPKSSKDYGLKRPETVDASMLPDDMVGAFGDLAHKLGLLPDQAAGVMGFYTGRIEAGVAAQKAAEEETRAALRQEWGAKYDENMRLAQRAVGRFGGEDALAALGPLENVIGGVKLVKLMQAIGAAMSEDTLAGAGSSGGGASLPGTPEGAQAEIRRRQADPEFVKAWTNRGDPKNADAKALMDKLYAIAYPQA